MAGQNIDLGTFQWDTNKIEHQIAANNMEMQRFAATISKAKEEVKNQSKEINILEQKIESERKAQERMRIEVEKGYRSQESFNSEVAKSNQKMDDYVTEINKAAKAQADAIIAQNRAQQSTKDLRLENNELNKLMSAGRNELSQNESAYRELNKELNALKTEAKNLGAQMLVLENQGKQGTDEYKKLASQFAETSQKANELNDKFKAIDKSVGDNQRSVGDYKDQIKGAFSEITIGLNQMAKGDIIGGLKSIQTGIGGITVNLKALYATMLANPITGVIVAFAALASGVALATKEIFDYNKEAIKDVAMLEDLFGKTGAMIDKVRVQVKGVAETFNLEFNDVAKAVEKLTKLGVAKDELEAIEMIKSGILKAPDKNQFISSLEDTAVVAKQVGINLDEVIAAKESIKERGIDGEAVFGSLQKATQNLAMGTQKTFDAMTNAFGTDFTNTILTQVQKGEISTVQALDRINNKSNELGLNQKAQADLQVALFGKQALAAGGFDQILGVVNDTMQNEQKELIGVQNVTKQLMDATIDLETAKSNAFRSDKVVDFADKFELSVLKIKTMWYNFIGGIIDGIAWFDELTGASDMLGETWDAVTEYLSTFWGAIQSVVNIFGDLLDSLGLNNSETKSMTKSFFQMLNPLNMLKGLFQGLSVIVKSFSGIIESNRVNIAVFAVTAKNVLKQVYDAAMSFKNLNFAEGLEKLKNISIAKEFANARKEAEKIANLKLNKADTTEKTPPKNKGGEGTTTEEENAKKAAEEARKKAEAEAKKAEAEANRAQTKAIADAKKISEQKQKDLEAEAKKQVEVAKMLAAQSSDIAKNELAEYILTNAKKFEDDKRLTREKLKLQNGYIDEVARQQKEILNIEKQGKLDVIGEKIKEIETKKKLSQADLDEIAALNSSKIILDKEYSIKSVQIDQEAGEKKKENNKKFDNDIHEQRKLAQAINYQQQLQALEEHGTNEYATRKIQLEQETQQKLDAFIKENELLRAFDQDEYDLKQEIQLARKEISDALKVTDDENERLRLQNQLDQLNLIESANAEESKRITKAVDDYKLQSRSQVFSGLASLFGKESALGKIFAGAEIVNNTAMNAQKAFAQAAVFASNPLTASLAPNAYIQGGIIIATGAAQLAKLVEPKKAAKGMLINGPSHSGGGVPISTPNGMIEAEGGEPILTKKAFQMFPQLISDINVAGGGIPLYASGGLAGIKPSNLSTVQNSFNLPAQNIVLDEIAVNQIKGAIYAGSQSGITDLSENRKIANGANF